MLIRPLRVLALAKQIPVFQEMKLGADGRLIRDHGIQHMNDYCRRAVAKGTELARESGGTMGVLTMGPPTAENICREALAFGVDYGIHLCDAAFAGSDTLATAAALARAIELTGPYDLILCGLNSIDADTGQVPPQIAQLLGLPFAAGVKKFEVLEVAAGADAEVDAGAKDDGDNLAGFELCLELEHDDELCVTHVQFPALVSCAERLCDPCKIKEPEIWEQMDAGLIRTLTAEDLGAGPWGADRSPTVVGEIKTKPVNRRQIKLEYSSDAIQTAAELCRESGALSGDDQAGTEIEIETEAESETETTTAVPHPNFKADALAIAVLVEPNRLRLTRELLGGAAQLAASTDSKVVALGTELPGNLELASYGAAGGVLLDSPLEYVTEEDLSLSISRWLDHHPNVWAVLAPGTAWGRHLASRLAVLREAGLTGDAIALSVSPSNSLSDSPTTPPRLIAEKPAFGGQLVAEISCTSELQMATVRQGVLPLPQPSPSLPAIITRHDCPPRTRRTITAKTRTDDSMEMATAEIVVGVGLGVETSRYQMLLKLCDRLGASWCATRKVTDRGWLPRARQVGITGHSIAPRLFISLGSSGNFNHMVGVSAAGSVLSINTDPDAPVFQSSDLGIVGDWEVVLPELVDALDATGVLGAAD